MPKTDIKLYSTEPSGKATTATISDVNPEATNAQLKTLGQMLNSFTRNRYDKTNRINTIQCDTEEGGGTQTATITLATESATLADVKAALKGSSRAYTLTGISYNGDGQLYAFVSPNDRQFLGVSAYILYDGSTRGFLLFSGTDTIIDMITGPITVKIRADATNTYKAAEATFTITA